MSLYSSIHHFYDWTKSTFCSVSFLLLVHLLLNSDHITSLQGLAVSGLARLSNHVSWLSLPSIPLGTRKKHEGQLDFAPSEGTYLWIIHVMWLWRMTQRDALKALCASFRAESGTAWIAIAAQGQSMRPLMQRAIPFRVFRL